MKWVEAKVTFDAYDPDAAISLISDFFLDIGQQGVSIETPEVEPGLDWTDNAHSVSDQYAVIGYIPANSLLVERCRLLEEKLAVLNRQLHISCRVAYRDMDEQDWAESWKAFFYPIKVGKNIVVKPSWREYAAQPDDIIIEIDPGMAFGTGTHATTVMCIQLIEKFIRKGDAFLDIGTGSGILMLAADKLGASRLMGIDSDSVAVSVARENLLKNQTPTDKFQLITGNLVDEVTGRFQLVAANIVADVIIRLLGSIHSVMDKNSILIASGIIDKKREMVEQELSRRGFEIVDVITQEEWVAIAARQHNMFRNGS